MKKNFLKVAALLIAAMLMVVSCTQEVAPVDNGLVEATIGLAYGKDVIVDYGTEDNTAIIYKYELTALWDNLTNGAPIYGATNDEVLVYGKDKSGNPVTKKLSDSLGSFNPNYVTPGYWKIDVKGYIGSEVVLSGTTKAYFNETKKSATVYVAPVAASEVKGNLTIELVMEDLDETDAKGDSSKIRYYLDKGTTSEVNGSVTKTTPVEGKAAHNYKVEIGTVTAGYHTITISVDGYSKGGVTRSFLMIPGKDVTVRGSIYPSEFINTESSITVVSLGQNYISIGETRPVEFSDSYSEGPVTVDAGSSVKVSIGEFMNPITNNTNGITYEWYVDGVKTGSDTSDAHTNITAPTAPGDYAVTCIAKLSYDSETVGQVTVYGDSKRAGLIRVVATNNKVATTN